MKIIAFGASSSKHSINKQFATFVANQLTGNEIEVLDLNDYEMPLYSFDKEQENGFPQLAHNFITKIKGADFLIISMAEHNGNNTAAFKNIFDWTSRIEAKIFEGKKMLLLSTSPGGRGGQNSLDIAKGRFPYHGAEIVGTFSLPKFYENFNEVNGITDANLKLQLEETIRSVK